MRDVTIRNMTDEKAVLVTGGAGFIGSHLCARLLAQEARVICIDSLITGQMSNIKRNLTNKRFSFIEGDVRRADTYISLKNIGIDEIYDLASPASVEYISRHPVEAATTNSLGTYHLLGLARSKAARFLFSSSSEVYGDPREHPQKESYWGHVNPVGVRSGYDEGKRFGEAIVTAYGREYGMDVRIARIFNTYGPNSSPKDGRVVPRFITSALSGKPLPVHGDGTQTRSFCHVDDLVDGLVRLMESNVKTPVNLGNPEEIRIIDIANMIIRLSKSTSPVAFEKRPVDDPERRMPDITKASELLHWQPKVSLSEGLVKTIEYFRK